MSNNDDGIYEYDLYLQNTEHGIEHLQLSAEKGNIQAQIEYGEMLLDLNPLFIFYNKDVSKGLLYLEPLANMGNIKARNILFLFYIIDNEYRNFTKAIGYYDIKIDQKYTEEPLFKLTHEQIMGVFRYLVDNNRN